MKRIVSLLLALCMLLSVCAFAAAEEETEVSHFRGHLSHRARGRNRHHQNRRDQA